VAANQSEARSFLPIGALAAYDSLGFALVPPILPALRERAHASPLEASFIFAGEAIGMFGGFVIAGVVIGRRGPRGAAIGGALFHLAGDLLFILGHTAGAYTAARLAQGLGAGMVWMAAVFAVLVRWPERPEPRLGRILTGFAAGAVVGPLVAALGGPVRPFIADACLAPVGLAAASFFPSGRARSFGWHIGALRSRQLGFALTMIMLVALVISVLEGSYSLHFASKLSQTGLAVLFTASTIAYGLGALLPVASGSLRESKASAQIGSICCAVLLLGIAGMEGVTWWFVLVILLGVALGATEASVLSIASGVAEGGMISAMTAYSQAFAVGFLIGPPAGTWLTTRFSLVVSALAVGLVLLLGAGAGFLVPVPERGASRDVE
jgi:ACDE family multidrug resistance protein